MRKRTVDNWPLPAVWRSIIFQVVKGKWQLGRIVTLMVLVLANAACKPVPDQTQEDKEPHYLNGRRLVQQMDYDGALKAFHKALEANPRSSVAHYEIGLIHLKHRPDPAACIYHLQRYLEYQPNAANQKQILDNIQREREVLARDVRGIADHPSQSIQHLKSQLNALALENQALRHQLTASGLTPNPQPATNNPIVIVPPGNNTPPGNNNPPPPSPLRQHNVKAGENPSSIARQYGISLSKLLAANPGLNPAKLQIGQELKIPNRGE